MLKNSKNNPNIYIEFMVLGIVLLTQLIFKIILCSRDNDCFHLQIRKLRHIKIKKFTKITVTTLCCLLEICWLLLSREIGC